MLGSHHHTTHLDSPGGSASATGDRGVGGFSHDTWFITLDVANVAALKEEKLLWSQSTSFYPGRKTKDQAFGKAALQTQ